jgi:ferredoxin
MDPAVRVAVDTDRCSGHARCFAVSPELFPLDDDGYVALGPGGADVPAGLEDTANRGVKACPERALSTSD